MPIRKTQDQTAEVMKALRLLTGTRLLVGIPDDSARSDGGATNAAIGYVMEHGAPERNIPARPHLVPGIETIKRQVGARMRQAGLAAFKGDQAGVEAAYTALGLVAQNAVRARIGDGPFVPLAPKTLAARRRRGRTGERPLIDTGQLRNAYTFAVKRKGG